MQIKLYGEQFEIYGFPVIKGNQMYAYATDPKGNIFLLFWATDKEPVQGNVQLIKLDK